MLSSTVVADDPGHRYHLIDGEVDIVVATTKAQTTDAPTTATVATTARDRAWGRLLHAKTLLGPLFKASKIAKSLRMSNRRSTLTRWLNSWVEEGKLYRFYSGAAKDPGGLYTFSSKLAGLRPVDLNNRARFGYNNPPKTSSAGLEILSMGLNHKCAPYQEASPDWHQDEAQYNSKAAKTAYKGDKTFGFDNAILGHKPPGCSGHFNNEGYRLGKAANTKWCKDPSNYQGPEHTLESSASGAASEHYHIELLAEDDCHDDFKDLEF